MNKKMFVKWLMIFVVLLYAFAFLSILFTKGQNWDCLIWHAESIGLFPDLSWTVSQMNSLAPYNEVRGTLQAIYPPFTYVFLIPLVYLIPGEVALLTSYSSYDSTVYFLFFVFFCILLIYLIDCYFLCSSRTKLLFCLGFVFSAPFLFCFERGNIVIVSTLLCSYYVLNYDSDEKIKKELALIALAFATGLKLYPVVLGVLLIIEKKYKEAIRCIVYGLVVFCVPILFLKNSVSEMADAMISGIKFLSEANSNHLVAWGFSFRIGITSITYAIGQYFNIENYYLKNIVSIFTIIVVLFMLIGAFVLKDKKKKIMALIMIMVYIPGFSWMYNIMYFLPVFILMNRDYKNDDNIKMIDMIYVILLVLLFVPMPYAELFDSLYGVQKISFNTLIANISLSLIFLVLIFEMILDIRKKPSIELAGEEK